MVPPVCRSNCCALIAPQDVVIIIIMVLWVVVGWAIGIITIITICRCRVASYNQRFCSLALGLIAYDYYIAVATTILILSSLVWWLSFQGLGVRLGLLSITVIIFCLSLSAVWKPGWAALRNLEAFVKEIKKEKRREIDYFLLFLGWEEVAKFSKACLRAAAFLSCSLGFSILAVLLYFFGGILIAITAVFGNLIVVVSTTSCKGQNKVFVLFGNILNLSSISFYKKIQQWNIWEKEGKKVIAHLKVIHFPLAF